MADEQDQQYIEDARAMRNRLENLLGSFQTIYNRYNYEPDSAERFKQNQYDLYEDLSRLERDIDEFKRTYR